ncbi:hypothetical protein GCK72_002926 [Caenorhabditis remanei]|uniref:Uncharacterized protein n=1 Tax=Caenorhabditis remanei TaxID=31234 RepID=A0A6A5HVC2_CAERE|nr:hypothetical protein GCK72_002926 [Caenorhabditis remanei]KAF1771101.1 hypothetical protein GCK72_002926 [Caenorhabditis remanei]
MTPVPVDLSKIDYKALLRHNVPGNGHYLGMRYQRGGQRGSGLGGIISAVFPAFLKSFAGQQLVTAGKSLASEMANGNDFKSSLKNVANQTLKNLANRGGGKKRGVGKKKKKPVISQGGRGKRIKGESIAVLKPHLVSDTNRVNFL